MLNHRLGEADGRRGTLLILRLMVAIRSNECMREDIVSHGDPKCGSIDGGGPKVNTSKHARVPDLFERGREALEFPRDPWHCVGSHVKRTRFRHNPRHASSPRSARRQHRNSPFCGEDPLGAPADSEALTRRECRELRKTG
jgi:hypothetical protein